MKASLSPSKALHTASYFARAFWLALLAFPLIKFVPVGIGAKNLQTLLMIAGLILVVAAIGGASSTLTAWGYEKRRLEALRLGIGRLEAELAVARKTSNENPK